MVIVMKASQERVSLMITFSFKNGEGSAVSGKPRAFVARVAGPFFHSKRLLA
jgi:hypothetical protein